MASMTMTTTFLAGSAIVKQPITVPRRGMVVANASSRAAEGERVHLAMKQMEEEGSSNNNGRREVVFAAAAAAAFGVFSASKAALADDEPKPGTPEAKKKYAPVCVTMPTARICRK